MAERAQEKPRRALAAWLAVVAIALTVLSVADTRGWLDRFHDRWVSIPSVEEATRWHYLVDRAFHATHEVLEEALSTALLASLPLIALGFVARLLARATVRAGRPDPLDRVRRWVSAHAGRLRAISAIVFGGWAVNASRGWLATRDERPLFDLLLMRADSLLLYGAGGLLLYLLARKGGAALLAPTLRESAVRASTREESEITFDAVAVTFETRAAVYGMMAANVAMMVWLSGLSTHALYHERLVPTVVGVFAAVALAAALLFRRASKVAVGVDGVRVQGTSRTRFYAYRDLDAARLNRTDIELVRGEDAVLRLQLHGEDAARRAEVLDRIRKAIDRVKEGRGAVAAQMVSSAQAEDLARAAGGGADYRGAALTRDQLWALVEGPEIDASARRATAAALVKTGDGADRARLRVAAERCAAPEVRGAIERLAEEEAHDAEVERGQRARTLP